MANFLQTVSAFVTDQWITFVIGLLILLIYRYVRRLDEMSDVQ